MSTTTDVFKDILVHTHQLGIFEIAKIKGTASEIHLDTVNPNMTVMLKAKLFKSIPEFVDTTIGVSRMGILQGFLNYDEFTKDSATVTIDVQTRAGVAAPSEVAFKSASGTTGSYRFMSAAVVDQQLKDFTFKGATFDITFMPTEKNLKDLQYFHSVLGAYESSFVPKVEQGNLYFHMGSGGSDRTKILVKDNITGNIRHEHQWDLDIVLKILKLGSQGVAVMSINNDGLLQIKVESGIGEYTYLLPAKG